MNDPTDPTEKKSLLTLFDAYLFRGLGLLVGWGGMAAMLLNNRWGHLFVNPYGLLFFGIFFSMALYSSWSVAADLRRS